MHLLTTFFCIFYWLPVGLPHFSDSIANAGANRLPAALQKLETDIVPVPGGVFTMGCESEKRDGDCYECEKPPHKVRITDFSIGRYEVTQAQWREVMGSNPATLYNQGCDECPVEQVSWDDVQNFLQKLNTLTGKQYRLPSEAEWEYAARSGRNHNYPYSGSETIEEVAWYDGNAIQGNIYGTQKTTRPVYGRRFLNEG